MTSRIACLLLLWAADTTAEGVERELVLHPSACAFVVEHAPADDIRFRPGRDVYGRTMAPADLPRPASPLVPRQLRIPLTQHVLLGLRLPRGLLRGEALAGDLVLDLTDGRLSVNGVPLEDPDLVALAQVCDAR